MRKTVRSRLICDKNIKSFWGSAADDVVKMVFLLITLRNGVNGLAVVEIVDAFKGVCLCVLTGQHLEGSVGFENSRLQASPEIELKAFQHFQIDFLNAN